MAQSTTPTDRPSVDTNRPPLRPIDLKPVVLAGASSSRPQDDQRFVGFIASGSGWCVPL